MVTLKTITRVIPITSIKRVVLVQAVLPLQAITTTTTTMAVIAVLIMVDILITPVFNKRESHNTTQHHIRHAFSVLRLVRSLVRCRHLRPLLLDVKKETQKKQM